MSTLVPGSKLGRYEIRSLIGAGGMGEVYRARDPELGRDVAIKVLPQAFSADPDRLRRFEQEARAAGTLNHPNILGVFDVGSSDGSPYVVTELLEGETLRDELRGGALLRRSALEYATHIAHGLAAAHEKGVVHRDLKPENVFITRDRRVKILDFGLAKLTQAQASGVGASASATPTLAFGAVTEPGVVMGTVGYMSPEQVRGASTDHRSDVFSFGVVLYEMLTGHRAFHRDTTVETMGAILKEEPPELSQPSVTLGPALERFLRHCLEKRSEARFQSMRDLAFDLESLSPSSFTAPTPAAGDASWVKPRRRDIGIGAAALAAGVAAAFLIVGTSPSDEAAAPPEFQRLTFRQGRVDSARFAPDGETVLYTAQWEGEDRQLYTTRPDSPESKAMGVRNALLLAVSSSGEMALRLAAPGDSSGVLAQMPMTGNAPRPLLENTHEAAWAPDGSGLAVIRQLASGHVIEFPLGTSLYQSEQFLSHLRFSPTGDTIAFVEGSSVCVVDLTGRKTTLSTPDRPVDGLAWSPQGEVWYSSRDMHLVQRLYAVTRDGHQRLLWRGVGLALEDIALDGRALFKMATLQRKGIRAVLAGETNERDRSWFDWGQVADISADGATILFNEGAAGRPVQSAYLRKTDGSPAIRLGDGFPRSLSPDGKWAMCSMPGADILLPTGVGNRRTLVEGDGCNAVGWFPDSKRVLLACTEAGHATRAYSLDLDTGDRQPLAPEGLTPVFRPSPDGSLIVLLDSDGVLWLAQVDGGEKRLLPGVDGGDQLVQWSVDGRSMYVRKGRGPRVDVDRLDLDTGRREHWRQFTLDPSDSASYLPIVITPDGTSYAYTYARFATDLYLVKGLS